MRIKNLRWIEMLVVALALGGGIVLARAADPAPAPPETTPSTGQPAESEPPIELPRTIPEAARRRPNPVKPTTQSVEHGLLLFSSQCAMCHGKSGDGRGRLAPDLGLVVPDFTDPQKLHRRTDGDLFYIITHGHGRMPADGDRMAESWRWDMVNAMRSMARTQ